MVKRVSISFFILFVVLHGYSNAVQAVTSEENIQVNLLNKAEINTLQQDFALEVQKATSALLQQAAVRAGLDALNTAEFNPNRFVSAAVVDRAKTLNPKELGLIDNKTDGGVRLSKVTEAQQSLLGKRVLKKDALRIGLVFSGGGYRAMILTLGYAHALAKMGIWDASSYISTLSGSTWFLSVFMNAVEKYKNEIEGSRSRDVFSIKPSLQAFEKTVAHFQNKIKADTFALARINASAIIQPLQEVVSPTPAMENFVKNALSFFTNMIGPKVLFDQAITSIDLYGGLLAQTLLSDLADVPMRRTLSDEWETIKNGNWPLPIRTSVTMVNEGNDVYKYHWFEFNPMEVRDCESDLAIPMYSFGRLFLEGKSVSYAPEPTIIEQGPEERLGNLMGIWGSAYTINLQWIKDKMQAALKEGPSLMATVAQPVLKAFEKQLGQKGAVKRLSPAQINNPFKECAPDKCGKTVHSWLSNKQYLTFIDAGIDFNLPLPPLYKEQRAVDVIIIGDSSGGESASAVIPNELGRFFQYIKAKQNLTYERIDDRKNATISVWQDRKNLKMPLIIYVNFKKDSLLFKKVGQETTFKEWINSHNLGTYDQEKALAGYAGTFNFDYTLEQFNQLYGIGYFNMLANEKMIKDILRDVHDRKASKPEEKVENILFGEI